MKKSFLTLFGTMLLGLSNSMAAGTLATPFVQVEPTNMFSAWTPNQLKKQATVDVGIKLPYQGYHNNWTVTFSSYQGSYTFTTSSSSNPDHNLYPLGSIPEGTYDIEFVNNDSRDATFDYWVACLNRWVSGSQWQRDKIFYNVEISAGCNEIYIDVL